MGFAKAAAAILQGVAPRVQDTYTNAANADAGYAHGLGSNVQQTINQQADANNAFLQKMGTPSGGLEHPADVGGTAYGLEGYIPATTLQREGAAFGSAAQMMPGDVLKQGQQQASATIANDPNLAGLQADLAKVAATQPAVYQRLLSTLSEMGYRKAELGLSAKRLQISAQQGQERLQQGQERINVAAQQAVQRNKQAWARIGISDKHLQLEIAKQNMSAKSGGLSPTEQSRYKALATSWSQRMLGASTNPTTGKPEPQLSFTDAMTEALKSGVPLTTAFPIFVKVAKQAGATPAQIRQLRQKYAPLDKALRPPKLEQLGPIGGPGSQFGSLKGSATLVRSLRNYPNLDPQAVMAIASQEGLSGGVGDQGTSFGPFQMHAGGALPARVWAKGARYAQKWAWSAAGINYALRRIEAVAGGLQGQAAIAAISRGFERPANPAKEIAGASSVYGRY